MWIGSRQPHLEESPAAMEQAVTEWRTRNPGKKPIRFDLDEATQPTGLASVAAMQAAVAQLGCKGTYRGTGPAEGYDFLREAACRDYALHGVTLEPDEIVVTGGLRDGICGVLELLEPGWLGWIADPCEPGLEAAMRRSGGQVKRMRAGIGNDFLPVPEGIGSLELPDVVVLCSPGNPTGAAYDRPRLEQWVQFACERGILLVFDASYEAFVQEDTIPHSVYELDGATSCAVELRTFARAEGLASVPCGLAVLPRALGQPGGSTLSDQLAAMRLAEGRAVSYLGQRGAEAALTPRGRAQTQAHVREYQANAQWLREGLQELGLTAAGGVNAPYVWVQAPAGMTGRAWSERLLEEAGIAAQPGDVFGDAGRDWVRLSGYCDRAAIGIALKRLQAMRGKETHDE